MVFIDNRNASKPQGEGEDAYFIPESSYLIPADSHTCETHTSYL
jgi:hypothetical protein